MTYLAAKLMDTLWSKFKFRYGHSSFCYIERQLFTPMPNDLNAGFKTRNIWIRASQNEKGIMSNGCYKADDRWTGGHLWLLSGSFVGAMKRIHISSLD